MASQQNSRATTRDTSPGHWLSRIPSTLSPTARPALRPSLNSVQKQLMPRGEELGSFSTCREYTDHTDENDYSDSAPRICRFDPLVAGNGGQRCIGYLHCSSRREG